jgi:hypothetical protein
MLPDFCWQGAASNVCWLRGKGARTAFGSVLVCQTATLCPVRDPLVRSVGHCRLQPSMSLRRSAAVANGDAARPLLQTFEAGAPDFAHAVSAQAVQRDRSQPSRNSLNIAGPNLSGYPRSKRFSQPMRSIRLRARSGAASPGATRNGSLLKVVQSSASCIHPARSAV